MKIRLTSICLLTAAAGLCTSLLVNTAFANEYTLKTIMKDGIKAETSIYKKIEAGSATAEEKAAFLEMCKAMPNLEPPKGDAESWKNKTQALIDAVQGVVDGKETATADLKAAINCKSCHTPHKG